MTHEALLHIFCAATSAGIAAVSVLGKDVIVVYYLQRDYRMSSLEISDCALQPVTHRYSSFCDSRQNIVLQ
jgi:hypothetical protein